ncbi:MAG: transcriptional coactivator p15/PC4 family protein [Loktanella sp.]|nr:transcriptional coactivator p15/PC4 family protein [Loktanella sp.]
MIAVKKNRREEIQVNRYEHNGATFVDIRVFFFDEAGEAKPTKRGVTLNAERAEALIEAINIVAFEDLPDA